MEQEFDQGYDLDHAYAMVDRYATGSDEWHYWMDEATRLRAVAHCLTGALLATDPNRR